MEGGYRMLQIFSQLEIKFWGGAQILNVCETFTI